MNEIYSSHPLRLSQDSKLKSNNINNKKQTSIFKDLLNNKLENRTDLKLSKHAQKRLQSRSIDFSKDEINKLEAAINKAKSKGAKESLVLINNNAYIVSVNNNTVITAMDKDSMEDNLFTNIDSAIIMK
ncbi:flagellar operon protein [Orenia metallireducens]|uniref:Flagellar operon protein n=1 Tax=Orenia metallireducens TaxID=1413210 RepID=A0A285FP86_9FIRM|nr:TIGR02530 family flagellar biosynthesis protein [Orenia metallireducens]PRX33670.1 flagellar operon protein [Orenia metallireducens]SNY13117.1 flagellar operon protein [Orenia metallireducens]